MTSGPGLHSLLGEGIMIFGLFLLFFLVHLVTFIKEAFASLLGTRPKTGMGKA